MNTMPFETFLLVCAIVAVMAVHSFMIWRKGQWRLIDPLNLFWAGCLVCYVEQPLGLYHILITWQEEGTINLTLFWCAFAMVCVAIGYNWSPLETRVFQRIPFYTRFTQQLPARLNTSRLLLCSLGLVGVGLLGYGLQIATVGWSNWISVGRGGTVWTQISGYVVLLADLLPAGTLMLLISVELSRKKGLLRVLAWIINLLMLLWLVYLGTRSRTVIYTMSMLAAYLLPRWGTRGRITPWKIAFIGILFMALSVVTKFQSFYRVHFTNLSFNLDEIDMEQASYRVLPHMITGAERDYHEDAKLGKGLEFNCVATVVHLVPDEAPYNYGFTLLELLTRPIPHFVWFNKRYPLLEAQYPVMLAGQLSGQAVEGDGIHPMLAGPAFTFVGYWYHVGGAFGLVIGGILTGSMFRSMRLIMDRNPHSDGNVLLYCTLLTAPFYEAAGTPTIWMVTVPFVLIPTLVTIFLCREKYAVAVYDYPVTAVLNT